MNFTFLYEFPDSNPKTAKQILDSITPPAGYYGFTKIYFGAAASSGTLNYNGVVMGGFPNTLIASGLPSDNWLPNHQWTPVSGAGKLTITFVGA